MKYRIDSILQRKEDVVVSGWVIGQNYNDECFVKVFDDCDKVREVEIIRGRRDEVCKHYFNEVYDNKFGFDIIVDLKEKENLKIVFENGNKADKRIKNNIFILNFDVVNYYNSISFRKKETIKSLMTPSIFGLVIKNLVKLGPKGLYKKIKFKLDEMGSEYTYMEWFKIVSPDSKELKKQSEKIFDYMPVISIVIPLYKTPQIYLKELIKSILNQTYNKFELCFADGSEDNSLEKFINEMIDMDASVCKKLKLNVDSRIKYKFIGENKGISGNTNEALSMVTGEYVMLCDHDDILTPDALYEFVKSINEKKVLNNDNDVLYPDMIYSDEDKIDMNGVKLFDPHFKPDFNIDLLRSVNYICHLSAFKKDLVDNIGKFRAEFDGAQDYDFILRAAENARNIVHIPKVLYHWRSHINSTSADPNSKLYAFEAGKKAIIEHYSRINHKPEIDRVETGASLGLYHSIFKVDESELVSIIIPNKDHTKDLDKVIRSVSEGNYHNIEFIIVENNSTDEKTFKYYEDIQKEFNNVKVVYWEHEFNYSKINNYGVGFASGEYLLFMNNDVEMINKDSIKEMLSYTMRDDVGICGSRLLYFDGSIQHAGVILGFGGIAGHAFIATPKENITYFNRALITQDYTAVTAAVMMTKKSVFDRVGGFSEDLAVAFNDIDFCMKVRKTDKLVVYNPYSSFYHYESKSRGLENTPEKIERFNKEIAKFLDYWEEDVKKGDPYYNPNLTLRKADFSIRDLRYEKIGEPYKIKDLEKYKK